LPSFNLPEEREVPASQSGAASVPTTGPAGGELEVSSIAVDRRADGAAIVLAVGGTPDRVTHHALAQPGRIVIDLFGVSRKKAKVEFMKVIDPLVRRVRVAHHEGRMRLVIDLMTDTVPAYDLVSQSGTLTLTLGSARPEATAGGEQ
jgi:hypothetical protein